MLQLQKREVKNINGAATPIRIYRNTLTNGELITYLLHTDSQKNEWWTFEDLFALPFIRQMAAKRVLDLYGHGLALADVKSISAQIKAILRSNSPEKYELAYAKTNELENLAETMADPVRQCMGMCTVYLLLNDEQPDTWTNQTTAVKMSLMTLDISLQSFFLNWWTEVMRQSGRVLKGLSQIALTLSQAEEKNTPAL